VVLLAELGVEVHMKAEGEEEAIDVLEVTEAQSEGHQVVEAMVFGILPSGRGRLEDRNLVGGVHSA
jgi:hypothetical protein